jgi:hypothetical protein
MMLRALCAGADGSEAASASNEIPDVAPSLSARVNQAESTAQAHAATFTPGLTADLQPGFVSGAAQGKIASVLTARKSGIGTAAAQIAAMLASTQKHDAGSPVEKSAIGISPETAAPAGGRPAIPGATGLAVSPATVTSMGTLAAGRRPEKRNSEKLENAAPGFALPLAPPIGAQTDAGRAAAGDTAGDPHSASPPTAAPAAPDPPAAGTQAPPRGPGPGTSALAFAARLIDRTASIDPHAPAGMPVASGPEITPGEAAASQHTASRLAPSQPPAAQVSSRQLADSPPAAAASKGLPPASADSGAPQLAHDAASWSRDGRAQQAIDENSRTRKAAPAADPTDAAVAAKAPAEGSPNVFENAPSPRPPVAAAPEASSPIDRAETAAGILRGGNATVAAARNATPVAGAAGPAQDISLRLTVDHRPPVDVSVSDRAGEVRVAVRSADPAMAEVVRSGLSDLAERLDRRGFDTEIFRPPAPAAAKSESTGRQESRDGGGAPGRGTPQDRGQESNHGQRQPPAWMEDMESGFATALKGTGV